MSLRQQRLRQERERHRIAESLAQDFTNQIQELHRSNRDHMIKLSRLEKLIAEKDRTIADLQQQIQEKTDKDKATIQTVLDALRTFLDDR